MKNTSVAGFLHLRNLVPHVPLPALSTGHVWTCWTLNSDSAASFCMERLVEARLPTRPFKIQLVLVKIGLWVLFI